MASMAPPPLQKPPKSDSHSTLPSSTQADTKDIKAQPCTGVTMTPTSTTKRCRSCPPFSLGRLLAFCCLLIAIILVLTVQIEYSETQKHRLGGSGPDGDGRIQNSVLSSWWGGLSSSSETPQEPFSCRVGSGLQIELPQAPDLIIAGAPKCGTTTLAHWLLDHPSVLPTKKWECHFFTTGIHPREFEPILAATTTIHNNNKSRHHEMSSTAVAAAAKKDSIVCELRKRYLHQWPALSPGHGGSREEEDDGHTSSKSLLHPFAADERVFTFDKTPDYLYPSRVAALIRALFEDSTTKPKIVILLRNPIDRAYSHYRMGQRLMREEHVPFEEFISREIALLQEKGLLAPSKENENPTTTSLVGSQPQADLSLQELDELFDQVSDELKGHNYLSRGLYAMQLERWFRHGLGDDMMVLPYPCLATQPEKVYSSILELVGMPSHTLSEDILYKKFNYNDEVTNPLSNSTRDMLANFFEQANQDLVDLLAKHNKSQDYDWQKLLSQS